MTKTSWKNFKNMLKATGTFFEEINPCEIAIPMVVNQTDKNCGFLSTAMLLEMLNDGKAGVVTDEGYAHILFDEKHGELNWSMIIGECSWL